MSERRVPGRSDTVERRRDLGPGREVPVDGISGVDLRDAGTVDDDHASARAVLVGSRRYRIEWIARFEVVLVQRGDHVRVVFDIGSQTLTLAL